MQEIEKNITMPTTETGRPKKYPFADMEVGDSILFKDEKTGGRAYSAAQMCSKRSGTKKFSGRMTESGLRIWRIV